MAEAVIEGVTKKRIVNPKDIYVSDVDAKRLTFLSKKFKINAFSDNKKAVLISDTVVLAVKPQNMPGVLSNIASSLQADQLFISIAAGISLKFLEKRLSGCAVVRAMPNNPCLIGEGMTVLSKGASATESDLKQAEKIFASLGRVKVLPEAQLDAVTGLSGSGPAFVYRFIEGLAEGGVKSGLKKDVSLELAVQTVLGAVKTVIETKLSTKELCDMVASPGGTTLEGLKVLDEAKFNAIVADTIHAAFMRAKQIREEKENG